MDATSREAARRLFVRATEVMEDALAATAHGQSPSLNREACLDAAGRLHDVARQLSVIARSIETTVGRGNGPAGNQDHE